MFDTCSCAALFTEMWLLKLNYCIVSRTTTYYYLGLFQDFPGIRPFPGLYFRSENVGFEFKDFAGAVQTVKTCKFYTCNSQTSDLDSICSFLYKERFSRFSELHVNISALTIDLNTDLCTSVHNSNFRDRVLVLERLTSLRSLGLETTNVSTQSRSRND